MHAPTTLPSPFLLLSPWWAALTLAAAFCTDGAAAPRDDVPIVLATWAEDAGGLHNAVVLAESLREFGGEFRGAALWIYAPDPVIQADSAASATLRGLGAEFHSIEAPEASLQYFFARKVFACADAERAAAGSHGILVWMDSDTIFLDEPAAFRLADGASFGFRPVMHQGTGSLYAAPPDSFWARVYQSLAVPPEAIFPIVTPADQKTLRAYFNAGLLVVRPERGIFAAWARDFVRLYEDPFFVEACRQERSKWIFLHQVALAGAALREMRRDEMIELSAAYNFPLFFKEQFGAEREFDSIDGVVTLRHESYLRNPAVDWRERLKGPKDKVAWIREHFPEL